MQDDPSSGRCTAHSTRTGDRCKRWPSKGTTVCATHGGRARQVQQKSRDRLTTLGRPPKAVLTNRERVIVAASITKPHKQRSWDRLPGWTVVYQFFDADGRLLYVGIAHDVLQRMVTHTRKSRWFPAAAMATFEHYPTRRDAEDREAELIGTLAPVFNSAKPRRVIEREAFKGEAHP